MASEQPLLAKIHFGVCLLVEAFVCKHFLKTFLICWPRYHFGVCASWSREFEQHMRPRFHFGVCFLAVMFSNWLSYFTTGLSVLLFLFPSAVTVPTFFKFGEFSRKLQVVLLQALGDDDKSGSEGSED